MIGKPAPRPGGRSARVQTAVHKATKDLLADLGRAEITIPLIAARAGVTPSTIYRRWGDLQDLLGDIALERLRPDTEPADEGSAHADLLAWAEQYGEEMSSALGRTMIRDVLAAQDGSGFCQCLTYAEQQFTIIEKRAAARGEAFPDAERLVDAIVAPILCRILFGQPLSPERIAMLVDEAIAKGAPALDKGASPASQAT